MNKSLLFLPDISGFTEFVQTTEVAHSQHIIAELLELLVEANIEDLQLAEVEGDALFFYKEEEIPSLEKLLAQAESMFTAFYSHLKLLEKNRICPCNACSSAPKLQLKIIAHAGEIEFINVQGKRKPFGTPVIQVHRLMKNSVKSDNYVLFSNELASIIYLSDSYHNKLFEFKKGENIYDDKRIEYLYAIIENETLNLKSFSHAKKVNFKKPPFVSHERLFPVSAPQLLEYITNYSNRYQWAKGVEKVEYKEDQVNRVGSEHLCVVNEKHFNFITVTKEGKPEQIVYGELTSDLPIADEFYQFYVINPIDKNSCKLELEIYWKIKSPIKKLIFFLFGRKLIRNNSANGLNDLLQFIEKNIA
jgi:ribosome-associated toxin RatA of RatAB toxin-antitoxin module